MTDKALWAFSDTSGNCSNTISLCEATKEDAPFIAAIYNQAILAGNCTCDTKTVTSEMREKWICQHAADGYPVYLCLENGIPVGYGYLTAYRQGREAVNSCGGGQLLFGLLGTRAPYRHSSACRIRATGKEART